jgi:HK97 gp10 family phage protein
VGPLKVEVSSNAPYAAALEFGTSKMLPRPYMQPATSRRRREVVELVRGAVTRVTKG